MKIAAAKLSLTPQSSAPLSGSPAEIYYNSTSLEMYHHDGTSWRSMSSTILQVVSSTTTTESTVSAQIPGDGTIPQSSEGTEILTCTITPKSSSSRLIIQCSMFVGGPAAGSSFNAAIFRASETDAIFTRSITNTSATAGNFTVDFINIISNSTTSSTTYRLRVGPNNANSWFVNRDSPLADIFSTTAISQMIITEVY